MNKRSRRLTKEQIKQIKRLAKTKKLRFLADKFKVSTSTIEYHISEKYKIGVKRRAREWFNALPEKKKKAIYKKNYEYGREYHNKRYHSDPEFKTRVRGFIDENKRKRKEFAKRNGLCYGCLNKNDGEFKYCSKCRKKMRSYQNEKKKQKKAKD